MTSATDLVGHTLGAYELVEIVGSGAMATVFKAFQPTLDRWVAVKVLHYRDTGARIRFQREAKAIAKLRHRNILIVYEYGEAENWPYIVTEYVQGGALSDYLSDRPLPWPKTVSLIIPVAEALWHAHNQGIIHRDVKPANILLVEPDWPVLADFGLVKLPEAEHDLTRTGTSLGTPAYVSPEQARADGLDHRADMYSLGVILFEMVTGRLPYDYSNPNRVLLAHISEPVPYPRTLNPDCPVELEKVIITLLQKQPDDRYDDLGEVIVALQNIASSETPVVPRGSSPVVVPSQAPPAAIRSGDQQTKKLDPLSATVLSKPADPAEHQISSQPSPAGHGQVGTDSRTAPKAEARIFLTDKKATVQIPEKEKVIIGRTFGNTVADIDLGPYGGAEMGISRHHARLTRQGRRWLIDDLSSLNGTFVNEVQVRSGRPVPLKNGDLIRCSHLSFIFLVSSGE
jgi:serine/threonine protein kinase